MGPAKNREGNPFNNKKMLTSRITTHSLEDTFRNMRVGEAETELGLGRTELH